MQIKIENNSHSLLEILEKKQWQEASARFQEQSIAKGRLTVIAWRDVNLYGTCLPEYQNEAEQLIERFLGYLPKPEIYLAHETFIRAHLHDYKCGKLTKAALDDAVEKHCKHIRNLDLKKTGWANPGPFGPSDYQTYELYLSHYSVKARERIILFFNQEFDLADSLQAEIFLRQHFNSDTYNGDCGYSDIDFRAMTILMYRWHLNRGGTDSADMSPLAGKALSE